MMPAHITRLMTFAQHGQPEGYRASDMMRADLETLILAAVKPAIQAPSIPVDVNQHLTNEQVTSECNAADEESYVIVPVKTLRRLVHESSKWQDSCSALSCKSWDDYPDRSGGQYTEQEIADGQAWR